MKTFIAILFALFLTMALEPTINISIAQEIPPPTCVCADCGYACKTPMVHASNCKYKNKRQDEMRSEEKSENKSAIKSVEEDAPDKDYEMLMIQWKIQTVLAKTTLDNEQKQKIILEHKAMLEKLTPDEESQKLLYDKIQEDIQTALNSLK